MDMNKYFLVNGEIGVCIVSYSKINQCITEFIKNV